MTAPYRIGRPVLVAATWVLAAAYGSRDFGATPRSVPGDFSFSGLPAELQDSLRIGLEAPREIEVGQPALIAIRLQNVSARAINLHLRGREIAFDLVITDTDGDTL